MQFSKAVVLAFLSTLTIASARFPQNDYYRRQLVAREAYAEAYPAAFPDAYPDAYPDADADADAYPEAYLEDIPTHLYRRAAAKSSKSSSSSSGGSSRGSSPMRHVLTCASDNCQSACDCTSSGTVTCRAIAPMNAQFTTNWCKSNCHC
ncbi:hypothetical protein MMC30_002696 [Trapelia coarctata]|nr:hypothetical protein [Trapelia coarctata]